MQSDNSNFYYRKVGRAPRAVRNETTGAVYESVGDAARAMGVSSSTVSAVASGRQASIGGERLSYVDGMGADRRSFLKLRSGRRTSQIAVTVRLDKERYDRLARAAVQSGEAITAVATYAVDRLLSALDGGETLPVLARPAGKPPRAIMERTSGTIFESVVAAATHYGLTSAAVSMIANGHHESRDGLRFSYVDQSTK